MFRVHWDTNNITVVALLVTTICVIVKVCQKLLYRRNGPVDRRTSNRNTYTACNSETCVRCHRYNNLRLDAPGKLNDFASKSGWSGLERLRKSLTSIGHPEGEVPDVTHRPNVLFVGGIESVPWWNADCFPANTELLEKNYENILDEYENEASSSSGWVLNSTESGRWKAFFLINQGCRVTENCRRCPKTMDLVENCLQNVMKECVFGNVFFSVVEAGTCISEHCGPANVRVRCHLGLHVPPDCWLTVAGETRGWTQAKCTWFDDSFQHSVRYGDNRGAARVVLLVDFWHPEVTDVERQAIRAVF